MRALTFHLPLIFVMLAATAWIFIIAASHPQWFKLPTSKRILSSTIEGMVCALVWIVVKLLVEEILGVTDFLDPAVAGLGWGGMSFYGKTRFHTDMYVAEKERLKQIFRR